MSVCTVAIFMRISEPERSFVVADGCFQIFRALCGNGEEVQVADRDFRFHPVEFLMNPQRPLQVIPGCGMAATLGLAFTQRDQAVGDGRVDGTQAVIGSFECAFEQLNGDIQPRLALHHSCEAARTFDYQRNVERQNGPLRIQRFLEKLRGFFEVFVLQFDFAEQAQRCRQIIGGLLLGSGEQFADGISGNPGVLSLVEPELSGSQADQDMSVGGTNGGSGFEVADEAKKQPFGFGDFACFEETLGLAALGSRPDAGFRHHLPDGLGGHPELFKCTHIVCFNDRRE
jgi:hypothetical protein